MKILIWCAMVSVGGGVRLLSNLATAMARQPGIELVRVVISSHSGFRERIDMAQHRNIEIYYEEQDIRVNPGHPYIADCDVVYAFWPHGPQFVHIGKPLIITYHDATILDFVPPHCSGKLIRNYWEQSAIWLERCTKIVVSSEHVKSRLVAHFGRVCESAKVIRHAISPIAQAYPTGLDASVSTMLPPRYLLYPANVSPHKNHYHLLVAYSRFSKRSQYPLVLFGHGTDQLRLSPPLWPESEYQSTLVSLIYRLQLKTDSELYPLGLIPDMYVAPIIKNAYALIMPSLSEGGGSYPVEEALSMGVPVLCSDIPVMREHLARRSAQIAWFDPESPDSICQTLEHFCNYYDYYKQSALAGMNDRSDSWDDIARAYIQVFYEALQHR